MGTTAGGDQSRSKTVRSESKRGGGKQAVLRARANHEAKYLLVFTVCSNAFNTVKRTAVLAEAAIFVPALTTLVAKMLRCEIFPRVL